MVRPRRLTALAIALVLGAGGVRVPPAHAGDEGPSDTTARLSLLSPNVATDHLLSAITDDGGHVLIQQGYDLSLPPGESENHLYDAIAGRFESRFGAPSTFVAASANGRWVVVSTGTALDPASDTDLASDLYLTDGTSFWLIRVNGEFPWDASGLIANDGSSFVFATINPYAQGDADQVADAYEWHRETGATDLLTPNTEFGVQLRAISPNAERVVVTDPATGDVYEARRFNDPALLGNGLFDGISDDGTKLFISSYTKHVPADANNVMDAYMIDADGYHLIVSPPVGSLTRAIRSDGSAVLIETFSSLAPGDADSDGDLYMVENGAPTLVTGGTARAYFQAANASLSVVAYHTTSSLVAADTNTSDDAYAWFAGDPLPSLITPGSGTGWVWAIDPAGTRLLFDSTSSFAAGDTDSANDAYRWTKAAGAVLLSPGPGSSAVYATKWSRDLRRVFLRTTNQLLAADTNLKADVYVSDLDVTPPVVTVSGPASGTSTDATYTVGSVGSEAVWYDCRLDGGAWARCEGTTELHGLSLGSHTVEVNGWDAAGNSPAAPASVTWTVLAPTPVPTATPVPTSAPDLAPPAVTGVALSAGSVIPGASVTVTATATDGSGVVSAARRLGAGSWIAMAAVDGSFDETTEAMTGTFAAPSTAGSYQVCVRATDTKSNTSDGTACATLTVMSYSLAPSTTSQSVAQGATGTFTVNIARSSFPGAVTLSASGLPAGATASFSPNPTTGGTAVLTITTSNCGTVTPRGTYSIAINGVGAGLARSTSVTLAVTNAAPTVTGPTSSLYANTTLGTSTARVKTAWSGCDADGIKGYTVQRQVNGGSWSTVSLASVTSTSINQSLYRNTAYRFRVRVTDKSGAVSPWRYGVTFRPRVADSTSTFTLTGSWSTSTPSGAYGGSVRYSQSTGASLSYSFTGSSIAWIAYKSPSRGSARVYVDGVHRATVSLYATTTSAKPQVYAYNWSTSGSHTIKIVVVGTAGHPRVDVDAFLRLSLT